MKLYLASKWDNRFTDAMNLLAAGLHRLGHVTLGRWRSCNARPEPDDPCFDDFIRAWGVVDVQDLDQADGLVLLLTNMQGSNGGCHWEAGYMAGCRKPVFVVTDEKIRSPFYTLPNVRVWKQETIRDAVDRFLQSVKEGKVTR